MVVTHFIIRIDITKWQSNNTAEKISKHGTTWKSSTHLLVFICWTSRLLPTNTNVNCLGSIKVWSWCNSSTQINCLSLPVFLSMWYWYMILQSYFLTSDYHLGDNRWHTSLYDPICVSPWWIPSCTCVVGMHWSLQRIFIHLGSSSSAATAVQSYLRLEYSATCATSMVNFIVIASHWFFLLLHFACSRGFTFSSLFFSLNLSSGFQELQFWSLTCKLLTSVIHASRSLLQTSLYHWCGWSVSWYQFTIQDAAIIHTMNMSTQSQAPLSEQCEYACYSCMFQDDVVMFFVLMGRLNILLRLHGCKEAGHLSWCE